MSEDSFERRRREREERRKQREAELKREEEEMERRREERKREREARRLELERTSGGSATTTTTTNTLSRTSTASSASNTEEEERRKREEERRKRQEEEEKEREREREREKAKKEAEEKAKSEQAEAEERAKKREEDRRRRQKEEEEEEEKRKRDAERRRKEKEEEELERKKSAEEEDRKRRERDQAAERERQDAERKRKESEEQEEEARRRKAKEDERKRREKEEQEEEELRQRRRREREREEQEQQDKKASERQSRAVAEAEEELKSLRSKISALQADKASLERLLSDANDKSEKLERTNRDLSRENDALKKEIEDLKKNSKAATTSASAATSSDSSSAASSAASVGTSEAPRLTVATKNRPTKAGRRGAKPTSAADGDKDEDDEPPAATTPLSNSSTSVKEDSSSDSSSGPRKTGNAALDLLASTLRGASANALKKGSSGNVFVSAGTKGGEITRALYMLKGKVRIRAVRVQDSAASITNNDVFILETKTHIWTYIGPTANKLKIARAVDVVGKMQRQRGQARAAILETVKAPKKGSYDEDSNERLLKQFWAEWESGQPSNIPEGEEDGDWEQNYEAKTSLFRVDPPFSLSLVGQGKVKQEDLESDKIYLLDTPYEMFVWCGRASDANLRKEAVENAQVMLQKAQSEGLKPSWTEVERVAEKGESGIFEDKFFKWSDSMRHIIGKVPHKQNSNVADSAKKQELPRILLMHDGELEPLQEYTDDLDGEPEITIVKDFRRSVVPKSEFGRFFSKNCYIILYRYQDTGVFYYWIGKDAGVTEQGTAASLAKEWASESGLNRPNLVRIDQGKENRHFLGLFKGELIVWSGERGVADKRPMSLFHIRGTEAANTRCFECADINGVYLNSDDVFLLNTKESQYLWIGEHANDFLRKVSGRIATALQGDRAACKTVEEGREPSAFKDAIGWSNDYAKHETRPNNLPVKLFICSNANKQYRADRQCEFVQSDLCHENQAILDRYSEVIVWLGRNTNNEDKGIALEVAVDYVEKANDGRKNCTVWVLDEGEEVIEFSRYFQAWDPFRQKSKKKHVVPGPPVPKSKGSMEKAQDLLKGTGGAAKYPLKTLLDRDYLPPGVDKKCLENYLRDEDFPEVFNMTAKEYWALPAWKRLEKKKGTPLF